MNALSLTRLEITLLREIEAGNPEKARQLVVEFGWLPADPDAPVKRHRERNECEEKFRQLNIPIPWLRE